MKIKIAENHSFGLTDETFNIETDFSTIELLKYLSQLCAVIVSVDENNNTITIDHACSY